MTSEQVAREVGEKRATLVGVQTELTRLTEEIRAISPEKANEFEKAAIDLLKSAEYSIPSGLNVRVAATDLLGEINKDPNPVAAYDKRRENLEALLTRVAAFVGEMKKMAEVAIQSAKDEKTEVARKLKAAEVEEAERKRLAAIATEAENNRLAALAAARAVVSDAITPPVRREAPSPTGAPASGPDRRGDGPTEQANADMKLKHPAEPRRDAEPLRTTPEVPTSPTVVIKPQEMLAALSKGAPDSVRTLVSEALGRCSEKAQFTLTPELVKQVLSQGAIGELLNRELAKNNLSDLDISELKLQKEKRGDSLILSGIKAVAREQGLPIQLNLSVEIALVNGLPEIRAIKHSGTILMQGIVNSQLQAKINEKGGLKGINAKLTQDGIRSALESQGISGDRVSLALDSSGNPVISLHKAQKPPPSTGAAPAPRTSPSSPPPAPLQSAPRPNDSDAQPHVSEHGPDRRTTQANAGIAFTQPDEQRRDGQRRDGQRSDGQGLEENDNRNAAEIVAAAEKAREKERILTLINEQMTVLKGLQVELDNFHDTIRLLSKIVDNDFGDAVYKLLKEKNYSYYEQDGNGNMVVQKLLTQIQSAADPVTEYATHKDRIESYVAKVVSLTSEVRRMADDFLKKAQVEKEREDVILKAGAEAKLRTEAAELARIKAEVGLWLKSIDDSIGRYQREYTAIDDDMKANFPQIYEEFTNRVRELGKKPEFNAKTSSTLDLLESARRDIRESPNHLLFLRYSAKKDIVADCLGKDEKHLAAIKELAEEMKREATTKAQAEADAKRRANEETEAAAAAELVKNNAEVDGWLNSIDESIKIYQREYTAIYDDIQKNFPSIDAEFKERALNLSRKPEYLFHERYTLVVLESARDAVRDATDRVAVYNAMKEAVKKCLEKDAQLLAAVKALAEEMKRAETATREAKAIQDTAAAKVAVEQPEPKVEVDPAKAARIKQLEAKIALEKSIINSPTSSEDRRKYAQRDLDPLEREYRILTHTASHEEWVAEVAKLKARIPVLLEKEKEIHERLRYETRYYIKEQEETRLRDTNDEQRQLYKDLDDANEQEKLTATAEKRVATSTPLPDAKVEGAARVVTNEAPALTREERWKKAIPSGSYTLESVPDSLHTLTIAGAQYEVFAVLCDDIKLPDGLNDPAAKKKEFMRQLNAESESTVIFFCKNKTTNEPQIVLYQHQLAGSIKALRQLSTLQQSEGSRLALEENGIDAITWADFALSPATYTFVLEQLKKNNLAIGPDLKGAYRADIVYDAGGPQLSFGQPLAASGENPSQTSLWEEDKKNASLGTAMVIEWVGAEQNISGIAESMNTDEAYIESIKKLNNLGIVDAKAHPYGVVEGVGKLIDFVGSIPVTEDALVAYMDYVGSYYGIPQNIIEASKRNRAEVLRTFIAKAESFKDNERGQYDRSRSECIDQVVAQARVSLPAVEAQCAQEQSAHTAHVEAQARLEKEQKLCARFVDEWKRYVDEQISTLEALIPQAKDTMSEENLNKFRKIVREYNTALDIIDEERGKKAMIPGWEALAATFPSDGASPAAARFAELKTQFEQLHLQESLDYTYAVTIFKQKYIDGVESYLTELRIFSAALGKISLEDVASRQALEQSRDQVITEKLRKVIEVSGYGKETGDKLATYADLYKSLSTPNSGVSPALVELQLPVIADALGKTYQTLIAETAEHAIAPTGYKTISEAIDRLREFKESVASKRLYVLRNIDDFRRIPGALTTIAKAVSPITDPAMREVITQGNKTSDYESLAQAAELYAGIRSALDKGPDTDGPAANVAEARVSTKISESTPQAAQVEGFVPYQGSTRTLAEAVRAKREKDTSPRVAYLEYYQKHPEKIVSFEGAVYLLGRTIDTGVNGRVFEAFIATEEQQAAMRESMGDAYSPSVIDESWIKANTPDQFINGQGVATIAGKPLVSDGSVPDFGAAHPEHVALKFKRKSTSFIGGQLGGGDAESFKREMQAFHVFEGNKTLSEHTPHLHGAFHERFKDQAIAMSWIDGELGMSGPVSEDEVLRVADELLSMIDASEQAGCPLGQDNLKPGSVAIGPDGQVQMIDLDTDSYVGRNKNLAYTLTTLIAGSNVSYGMSELLSRISGLEDLKSADARRVQIQNIRAAIAEYRALRSLDVPTLTAQMNDPTAPSSRRLAAFELLSEKMKGKVSPEQATMASQLYFDQSVNTTMSRKERDLSQSLGSTRFPADMRYLILPHIPLTETQAVQNTKDGNLDKLAEQFPANRELQALIAALRQLSEATTQTGYREREQELEAYTYGLANAYKDIPGSTLAGASEWFAKLIPYSRAKGRERMLSTARDIIGMYRIYPVHIYGLADLTGNIMPVKKIEVVQEEYPDTTKIDLKPIKDGGCIVDSITYPRNSTDRPELTISNGWVSTRFVDVNMTLEPNVPWSSIDKLVAKDSRITLKGGQGRHVDSWIDGAIRIAAPPEKTNSPTQLFVRSVKIHEQFVDKGAKFAPVRLDIEDAAAKVLVGVGSEDIACDHKDQLYILDKIAFGEQYKINIPANYAQDSITFAAQSAEGNKNAHVVFVRRKIGTREEWLFSHFVDDDSKSDGKQDIDKDSKTVDARVETAPEQLGQPTVDEANSVLESWTNFTQKQKTENPTLSFESDSRLLRSAISNLLNARARGQDLVKLSGLLDALEAQIPISQRNLEAAKADPVAYAKSKAESLAHTEDKSGALKTKSEAPGEIDVPEMTDELRALIPKMYLDSFARAYKKSIIGGGFMDTTGRPFDCTYDGGTGILELRRKGGDTIRVRYTS